LIVDEFRLACGWAETSGIELYKIKKAPWMNLESLPVRA
jgi:hypothetical protein